MNGNDSDRVENAFCSIATIVNGDFKSAVFLMLSQGTPLTAVEARDELRERVSPETNLVPHGKTIEKYLDTLWRISKVLDRSNLGYTVNEFGVRYAQPIVAELMNFSRENDKSMYELLGPTWSTKPETRAHLARLQILDKLRPGNKATLAELAKGMERPDKVVNIHLESLRESGFINYETAGIDGRKGQTFYEPSPQLLSCSQWVIPALSPFYASLVRHIMAEGEASAAEVYSEIGGHKEDTVRAVLNEMTRDGFLQKIRWTDKLVRSEATISELGAKYIDKWNSLKMAYAEDGEKMRELRAKFRELENPDKFRALVAPNMRRYKSISPRRARMSM